MITINGHDIYDIVIDNKNVIRVQDADTLDIMWEKTTPVHSDNYLYFENPNQYSFNVYINTTQTGNPESGNYATSVQWSKDKSNWTTMTFTPGTSQSIQVGPNEKVYFRNNNGKWNYMGSNGSYCTSFGVDNYYPSICNVGGDIRTICKYSDINNISYSRGCYYNMFSSYASGRTSYINAGNLFFQPSYMPEYGCQGMFSGSSIEVAPTILDSLYLSPHCYEYMFEYCDYLTTAPVLPATTLSYMCYASMFHGCTSLTTPPALPATTLADGCYDSMFSGCTLLSTAPSLPATTLTVGCYGGMFQDCQSLTSSPLLPATTLTEECYANMFAYCSNLEEVSVYANDISATNCLYDWLVGVAATGTFHNYGSAVYQQDSGSGIPSGWTEV